MASYYNENPSGDANANSARLAAARAAQANGVSTSYGSDGTPSFTQTGGASSGSYGSGGSSSNDDGSHAAALAALKDAYGKQLDSTINMYNTERSKIPGQVTVANNQASSAGMTNANHIRTALAQMGLLQSGESASQQLANDIGTASNINANNLQGQSLDASYADKIAAAQAANAINYNNAAYQYGRDAVGDNQWNRSFGQQQAQDAFNNGINAGNLTRYVPKIVSDLYPAWAANNPSGAISPTTQAALPASIAAIFPNATNVTESANGYSFTSANGVRSYYPK